MTGTPLLTASGLGAMRGERLLFTGVSLSLGAGEALLLRGNNGSGKTTLLRTLAGLAEAETGNRQSAPFHWIGHKAGIKPHESPREHLRLWAAAWGAPAHDTDAILARMGLTRARDVAAASLSAGQRRRTALARTQLIPRKLWLLDEPFSALDADGRSLVADMIADHRQTGGALIAAVHGDVPVPDAGGLTL